MPGSTKPSLANRPTFGGLALIAGHPALDFLNTVKFRGKDDPQDKLSSISDVIEWAQLAGLLSTAESIKLYRLVRENGGATRVHKDICSFREQARTLFEDSNSKSAGNTHTLSELEAAISALRPTANIDRTTGVLTRHFPIKSFEDMQARIVAAVAEILSNKAELRIGTCGGFDCDWVFVDRTKAGRRQWCDSRTCGNIARVRRYRKKH